MGIRQMFAEKRGRAVAVTAGLVLAAAGIIAVQSWPDRKAKLEMAYFTIDDGQTWFQSSIYDIAPFQHDGKEAVIAVIYSYANGSKTFCPYMVKYTPEAKRRLEGAIAEAKAQGKPPGSVALFHDRTFLRTAMLYRAAKSKEWVASDDPRANEVQSVRSPDGSEVDQVFVY